MTTPEDMQEDMHQHFFYVMDNFEKLSEKVEELEQNMAVMTQVLTYLMKVASEVEIALGIVDLVEGEIDE